MICPGCHHSHSDFLFEHRNVPVHQNFLYSSQENALASQRGNLSIHYCRNCELIFNSDFKIELLNYGSEYENNQTFSPAFSQHIDARVSAVLAHLSDSFIEIGCGNGYFIQKLIERSPQHCQGWGYDPSYRGNEILFSGRLRFIKQFLDTGNLPKTADAVICRHVIEHIPSPLNWLRSLRKTMASFPNVRLFFETPSIEWIFKNQVFWDFFYEHCNYFSKNALFSLFEKAGMQIIHFEPVFGGQYFWWEAELTHSPREENVPTNAIAKQSKAFADSRHSLIQAARNRLSLISPNHKIGLWGAGAKGVTLTGILDPDARLIDSIIDINPNKQGHYLPGTGHLIIAPEDLKKRGIRQIFILNPEYKLEIENVVQEIDNSIQIELFEIE